MIFQFPKFNIKQLNDVKEHIKWYFITSYSSVVFLL